MSRIACSTSVAFDLKSTATFAQAAAAPASSKAALHPSSPAARLASATSPWICTAAVCSCAAIAARMLRRPSALMTASLLLK